MEPFVTHRGRVALLDWTDVNTDLIIPARYLKKIERTGFGPLLFADKRYAPGGAPEADHPDQHGQELPEFPLNDPALQGGDGPGRRAQLRLRLEPRARGLGRDAGGLSRGHRARAARSGSPISSSQTHSRTACSPSSSTTPTGRRSPTPARKHPGRVEVTIDLRDQTVKLHSHADVVVRAGRRPVSLRDSRSPSPPAAPRPGLDRRDLASRRRPSAATSNTCLRGSPPRILT